MKLLLPLSEDLRWRVVMLYQYRQYSISEISNLLVLSKKSGRRILIKFNTTGNVAATNRHLGPERMLGSFEEMTLVQFLMENPGACLDELQTELYQRAGLQCSMASYIVSNFLQATTNSKKKLRRIVMKHSDEAYAEFKEEMASIDANMVVRIDEIGETTIIAVVTK